MTDNVVGIGGVTRLDIPVERVINAAKKADLDTVIIIGTDQDGDLYFASSQADGADILWWLEMVKKRLLEIGDV